MLTADVTHMTCTSLLSMRRSASTRSWPVGEVPAAALRSVAGRLLSGGFAGLIERNVGSQHVADAVHRLDEAGSVWCHLPAKRADVDLDDVRVHSIVDPYPVHQVRLGEHLLGG